MEPIDYLKKFNNCGFQAYIVGGYVRDLLLGIESTDVDITTNAKPEDICRVLNINDQSKYGSISIKDGKYNIDITTFRKESRYRKHNRFKVKFISSLKSDLKRRDFTINALCLDADGVIIDLFKGKKDLDNRIIRPIGRMSKKFKNDPLRILRALRFSICYDYKLENKTFKYIIKHRNLINEVSYTRKREELERIFSSENVSKGMHFLNDLNILSFFDIEDFSDIKYAGNIYGMWAQINYGSNYQFKKSERVLIENIKAILQDGKIDSLNVFKYGLEASLIASKIMDISSDKVREVHKNLGIHSPSELNIKGNEIENILKLKDKTKIKSIKESLILQILSGNLTNEEKALKKYLSHEWK